MFVLYPHISDLKEKYPNLVELEDALGGTFANADDLFSHLSRVQQFSWGDFLCSSLFRCWLMDLAHGVREAKASDYDRAAVLIELLPGLENSGPHPGRGWSPYEETYPGRFINMRTLKNEIMQVHFPHGNMNFQS